MPVVFLQAGQWNWFFFRLATAKRPQRSHTCTLYASLWSNNRSCNTTPAFRTKIWQTLRNFYLPLQPPQVEPVTGLNWALVLLSPANYVQMQFHTTQ